MWDGCRFTISCTDYQRLVKDIDYGIITGAVRYGDVTLIQFNKEHKDEIMGTIS